MKALQAELGEERANSLVRRALGDVYRRYGEEFWRRKNEKNLGKIVASAFATYARENALVFKVIEQSQDTFEIDVTRCRYAEFYKELGEPELGPAGTIERAAALPARKHSLLHSFSFP